MRQAIVGAAVAALVLAGCSSDGQESSESGPTTSAAADATTTGASDIYVVQEAGAATLGDPDESGARTLTLADASERSVTFTGSPSPQARTAPTGEVVDALATDGAPHEAALSWSSPNAAGTLVVSLRTGTYDASTGTLTYQVVPLAPSDAESPVVAARASTEVDDETGTTLPTGITRSTLFIDPIGQDQAEANCSLTVVNSTPFPGEVATINRGDRGGMVDWDRPFTDGQAVAAGQQITASSGDSDWDCHAHVGIAFTSPDGDFYEVYVALEDPVFSKSTWSCEGPPELGCAVEANEKGQPFDMTVTISA